ncbi:hypothetical protein SCHPADRAFT_923144 [Schizopora paradoxa]|uniref:Methyltransferase domain-containing protein n=1 Tax=Schizopora paradoxa TaxID=27342 RepID=A0A0H2R5G7_9AGAM|nr:hypothetical protein SCHPADRAFT_923144 [Schizopora paradoxa]
MSAAMPEAPIKHNARNYQSYPGSNYVLPADEKEVERLGIRYSGIYALRLQHEVLKKICEGRTVFPPLSKGHAYFILDSGVGSASWLLEAAEHFSPSAILHGIDIERRLFPPEHPSNVSFSLNSITSLPLQWTGKFDFVHQRLLIAALRKDEWVTAISSMHRILRPGGWIQLGEVGSWHAGPVTKKQIQLIQTLFESRQLVLDVSKDLRKLVEQGNFTNVTVESRLIPLSGTIGRDARINWIGVTRGMKTPVLRSGGFGFVSSEEEFDALIDDVEKEWESTDGAAIEYHVICAQKPE